MKKIILILFALFSLSACSTFNSLFPDTRTSYKQAQAMPDLEIPPDLTAGTSISDMMAIPGEGKTVSTQTANTPLPKQAQIQTVNDKILLSVPLEFSQAWLQIKQTLTGVAGMTIGAEDQNKGTFEVIYEDPSQGDGWFSFLTNKKTSYVISVTGVGDKSELVILNSKGEWKVTDESDQLLNTIMTQYNVTQGMK